MAWKIREIDGVIDGRRNSPNYGANIEYFTIRVHHSGKFITKPKVCYIGGEVSHIDYCCTDELSKIEIDSMLAALGLQGSLECYYSCTGADDTEILNPIRCDRHALELGLFSAGESRVTGLFVDHESLPFRVIAFPSDNEVALELGKMTDIVDSSGKHLDDVGDGDEHLDGGQSSGIHVTDMIDNNDSGESDEKVSIGDDSELSEYYGESEGNYDIDNRDFDAFVDPEEEWIGLKDRKGKRQSTIPERDDETNLQKRKDKVEGKRVALELGMVFLDAIEFRKTVRSHAIQLGRELIFPINNQYKVQAKCKNISCKWLVYASRVKSDDTFIIKTIFEKHSCPRLNKVVHANSKFLADKYKADLKADPKWPVQSMIARMENENKVSFTKWQMYRCKKKATILGNEDVDDQYSILWRYGEEILRTNPGTTVRIKCKDVGGEVMFKRFYLCWDALKRGMLDGCRRIICLDGCHLKTIHGGVLLTAVGLDPNNGIYPFAYAIVEKEKKKSWMWFLDLIVRDLDIQNNSLWTVMSDKQKGLIDAVNEKLPHREHRFCVVHLYQNFKLLHKGLELKSLLWRAARATRVVDFSKAMQELRFRNVEAFEWLQKRDPKHWSRSHFSVLNKTDLLYNNLSESFNSMILSPRSKPVLQMLEGIRLILMLRVGIYRAEMTRNTGDICPNIEKILDINKENSHKFKPIWNGENEFNVEYSSTVAFKVNLGDNTCSCRKWELTGIPCPHAISCIYYMGVDPRTYVHDCYKRETYLRVYDHFMHPLNSQEEWPNPERCKILPPRVGKMPGRPKKYARRLQPDEKRSSQNPSRSNSETSQKFGKSGKKGLVITCRNCGIGGHNSRSCAPKRGNALDIPAPNPENKKVRGKGKLGDSTASNIPPTECTWLDFGKGSMLPGKTLKGIVFKDPPKTASQPSPQETTSRPGHPRSSSQPDAGGSYLPSWRAHPKFATQKKNSGGSMHVPSEVHAPPCTQQ